MKGKKFVTDSEFFQELMKQKNVSFLNEEETREMLANTEFSGCIAMPKNTNKEEGK